MCVRVDSSFETVWNICLRHVFIMIIIIIAFIRKDDADTQVSGKRSSDV